jgi:hypothetical protein
VEVDHAVMAHVAPHDDQPPSMSSWAGMSGVTMSAATASSTVEPDAPHTDSTTTSHLHKAGEPEAGTMQEPPPADQSSALAAPASGDSAISVPGGEAASDDGADLRSRSGPQLPNSEEGSQVQLQPGATPTSQQQQATIALLLNKLSALPVAMRLQIITVG